MWGPFPMHSPLGHVTQQLGSSALAKCWARWANEFPFYSMSEKGSSCLKAGFFFAVIVVVFNGAFSLLLLFLIPLAKPNSLLNKECPRNKNKTKAQLQSS